MAHVSRTFQPERPPAVAGTFYPGAPSRLRAEVEALLAAAPVRCTRRPKALVVPHAGYVYSGPIAASGFAQLRAPGPPVERVVLLGPAHHVPVAGLALPGAAAFLTPLGAVPLDPAGVAAARALPQVGTSAHAHALEHSLEVQLPFLQVLLPAFTLVPLAVGRASPEEVAAVLDVLWGGPETLVLISTDLSHHLPIAEARALDGRTARQVLALDAHGLAWEQACGRVGLSGLLVAARRHRLTIEQLDLRTSGDTAGDADAVVGYAAFALHEPAGAGAVATGREVETDDLRAAAGNGHRHRARLAVQLARAGIEARLGGPAPEVPAGERWLQERRACFVSLHRGGELRGCVGTVWPRGRLGEEIVRCAQAAAFEDPRFDALGREELRGLAVEVTVLSEPEPLQAASLAEALAALRPGVDGVVLDVEGRRAVFIPQMWAQLPDPADFLSHLRRKAGLAPGWSPGTRLWRFTAEVLEDVPEAAP